MASNDWLILGLWIKLINIYLHGLSYKLIDA